MVLFIIANNMLKVTLHAVTRVHFGVIIKITCWIYSSKQGTIYCYCMALILPTDLLVFLVLRDY